MPPRNTKLCFDNYHKQLPIPLVVYADFECFTKPMSTCSPNPEDSYNCNYQKHEPSGFCLYIKGLDPNITFKPILYTKTKESDNIPVIFVSKVAKVTNKIYNDFYCRPTPLKLTPAEQESFNKAETCHICKKELLSDKVRDHCHFTGKYHGAAHNSCNLPCRKYTIKLSTKPNFDRATIFDRNLIAVHMKKTEVYFNKPVYVGQAILDLSKILIFDFHYDYIRKKYDSKVELLFTDTDSCYT